MANNNFQKIIEEREAMLPPELEGRMTQHMGTFAAFGKVVELFVPNALQTVVRLIGGDDLPCLDRKGGDEEPSWRKPPLPPPTGPKEQ
jgi:hypothetical protein